MSWEDKTRRDEDGVTELEFEYVEPFRWLMLLWYSDGDEAWYLSTTRMSADSSIHIYDQERNPIAASPEEAKAWAEKDLDFKKGVVT